TSSVFKFSSFISVVVDRPVAAAASRYPHFAAARPAASIQPSYPTKFFTRPSSSEVGQCHSATIVSHRNSCDDNRLLWRTEMTDRELVARLVAFGTMFGPPSAIAGICAGVGVVGGLLLGVALVLASTVLTAE